MKLQLVSLQFVIKWLLICIVVGFVVGSASAFFLVALDWATHYRESHTWLIWLLPLAGLVVGGLYHYWGASVAKGNNQLIEELQKSTQTIPLLMMPLILVTTVITHLFGGSAGREGTAVQMGGALADNLYLWGSKQTGKLGFKRDTAHFDRKIILIVGISAGFASVFGTPLAGTVFALEVAIIGKMRYEAILPSLLGAIVADYVCQSVWHVGHTHYVVSEQTPLIPTSLVWAMLAGAIFGLMGLIFAQMTHAWGNFFKQKLSCPPLRAVIGGVLVAILLIGFKAERYSGLGVPVIVEAFQKTVNWYDFLGKTFFTSLTLGSGFKGGEVTPLFYIGATLGNTLSTIIPLPLSLLAAMGFVGVFSGASNTPLACTLMGIELFGAESAVFIAIACITAYLFSGHVGIYASQIVGGNKAPMKEINEFF